MSGRRKRGSEKATKAAATPHEDEQLEALAAKLKKLGLAEGLARVEALKLATMQKIRFALEKANAQLGAIGSSVEAIDSSVRDIDLRLLSIEQEKRAR